MVIVSENLLPTVFISTEVKTKLIKKNNNWDNRRKEGKLEYQAENILKVRKLYGERKGKSKKKKK